MLMAMMMIVIVWMSMTRAILHEVEKDISVPITHARSLHRTPAVGLDLLRLRAWGWEFGVWVLGFRDSGLGYARSEHSNLT